MTVVADVCKWTLLIPHVENKHFGAGNEMVERGRKEAIHILVIHPLLINKDGGRYNLPCV